MRKADSLTLPRPKGKHSHATGEQEDQISVRKSESSPLSLSSGRSRSAERLSRAGKTSKEMKRRSVPSAHPEKTEEHKPAVDEEEKSEDVLNNLQHAAQFTITILPHGEDFERPPPEKKVRAGHPTTANHSNESPETADLVASSPAKSSPPSTTATPRVKGMRARYQSDVTHLPREKVLQNPDASIVKINVGGMRFMTTMDSLKSRGQNFLTLMVYNDRKGIIPATVDDKGYYFVDRSGDLFKIILEYLRTGQGKLKHEIMDKVEEMKDDARTWLDENKPGIEKFIRDQCSNGVSRASLVAYLHKASNNYQTRLSGGVTLCWPNTSMLGRGNNMWLDVLCHIVKTEWGILTTWTSYDSSSFQVDFDLSATALWAGTGSVYGLLKSWERSYARGPGLYVYKSWIK